MHVSSLDGLRAFSVLMVISSHLLATGTAPSWLAPLLRPADGALGVRIFFCISGFLITYLMLREKFTFGTLNIRLFLVRRILRIVPVNYAFILVLVILSQLTALDLSLCQVATAVTFTKNYGCGSWIDGHLWSLSVEAQFYMIWPFLVARLGIRQLARVAVAAILVAPISRALEYGIGHRAFFWLPSHTDALMIGGLAAMLLVHRREAMVRTAARWTFLLRGTAFALMVLPIWLSRHLWLGWFTVTLGPTLQALCATYLIGSYVLHQSGPVFRLLNARPVVELGRLSYSLYVWQQIFMSSPLTFGVEHSPWLSWPVNIVSAFLVAALSYHCLEQPFFRWRRAFHPGARPDVGSRRWHRGPSTSSTT